MAGEKGERAKINLTPQSLAEFRPKSFKEHYDDGADDDFWEDSDDEKETQADKNDDAGWNAEEPKKKGKAKTEGDDFDF